MGAIKERCIIELNFEKCSNEKQLELYKEYFKSKEGYLDFLNWMFVQKKF